MYLTGQLYPRPWEVPDEPQPIKKNIEFYGRVSKNNVKHNLWDNKYRTSKKYSSFYQQRNDIKNNIFASKDLEGRDERQQKQLQQQFHMYHKTKSQERLKSREVERKMVQFKSNQRGIPQEEAHLYGEMDNCEDTKMISQDLSQKRGNHGGLKSPEKNVVESAPQLWTKSRINQYSTDQIKSIIQKKTLFKDQDACKFILKNIVQEKEIAEMEKNWHKQNRHETRQKFFQRHEENIELEAKAGVKKNYVEIEPIESDMKRSQFSNMLMDQINKSHETIFSINNPNLNLDNKKPKTAIQTNSGIISRQTQVRTGGQSANLPSKRGQNLVIQKDGSKPVQEARLDTLDRQKEKLDRKSTEEGGDQDVHLNDTQGTQVISMKIKQDDQQQQEQEPETGESPQMNMSNMKSMNYEQIGMSKFRVNARRNARSCRYPKLNNQIEEIVNRLHSPKMEYIPRDPYQYSDFRGLLSADFKEALTNCFSQDDLNRINTEQEYVDMINSSKVMQSNNNGSDINDPNASAGTFFNVFPVPQSLKNIRVIGEDEQNEPILSETKLMYKTKSIMSNDPVTNQVFNNTGQEGQLIWQSLKNMQKSKSTVRVTPSNTFAQSVSRPLTSYQMNKQAYRQKFIKNYGQVANSSINTNRFRKTNSSNFSQMDPSTVESANTMREISKFEKMHGLERVGKSSNKYPKKNLVSNQAMEKRYFSGRGGHKPANSEFLNALELEQSRDH